MTESQGAPDKNGLSEEPGSLSRPASIFRVRIPGDQAFGVISRAGKRVRLCPL